MVRVFLRRVRADRRALIAKKEEGTDRKRRLARALPRPDRSVVEAAFECVDQSGQGDDTHYTGQGPDDDIHVLLPIEPQRS
jgi:hypothetical protein